MSQPVYATVSSSAGTNASPWKAVDWTRTPINISIAGLSSGGSYWFDYTLDDPTGTIARPSSTYTFVSSAIGSSFGSTPTGVFNLSSVQYTGNSSTIVVTFPIAAWRIVSNSSTAGGVITAVGLQAGFG